ncbi:MAG: hypothetical protein VR68_03200 [Peptococcaceae bacterium BRH_c4a]|nr:MAG: hypothetical protein VR68_03200 [Peptococcaceae bacterium BRH_c4a]
MIIIGCGECGGKYQVVEARMDNPKCPSCGVEIPDKIRGPIKSLVDENRNRPNWKLFIDMGNMFNIELTVKSRSQ